MGRWSPFSGPCAECFLQFKGHVMKTHCWLHTGDTQIDSGPSKSGLTYPSTCPLKLTTLSGLWTSGFTPTGVSAYIRSKLFPTGPRLCDLWEVSENMPGGGSSYPAVPASEFWADISGCYFQEPNIQRSLYQVNSCIVFILTFAEAFEPWSFCCVVNIQKAISS